MAENYIPLLNREATGKGVSSTAQDLSVKDDSYFNISEMELSITSLFSVQIMSYLGAQDIIYSSTKGSKNTRRIGLKV